MKRFGFGLFKDKVFLKELCKVALPIAAQSLMLSAVGVADTLMLGGVEQNAMSAVSLATKIQFIQNIAISSMIAAFIALAAQYWGKQDREALNRLFCITIRLTGTLSVLFFVGCEFFPHYLMLLFTDDPELIRIASEYLKIAAWSYLLTGFSQCYLALLKTSDHAGDTAVISTTAVICNIGLNAVFIFGLFGLPALGVAGVAWATFLCQGISCILAMIVVFRRL